MRSGTPAEREARSTRLIRLAWSVALAIVALAILVAAGVSLASVRAAAAAGCQPGSGPQLAGRQLTDEEISGMDPGALRCANLTGSDLSGLSLGQVDFTGAILRHASLQDADLTQATLDDADMSGANLQSARLDQATFLRANLSGADLSGASMIQADLTGANLSHAKIGGADLTQATLTGANFTGVTGEPPYSLYLLIGAIVIFALLAGRTVIQLRSTGAGSSGYGIPAGQAGGQGWILATGLAGALVVASGVHLFAGGLASQVLDGAPLTQTCTTGPLCKVGVGSGLFGIPAGVVAVLIGFAISGAGRRVIRPTASARRPLGSPVPLTAEGIGPGGSVPGRPDTSE